MSVDAPDILIEDEIEAPSADISLAAQEEDEDARLIALAESYDINGQSCIDDDETTLWLKYTQWVTRLAGKPLDILAASAQKPALYASEYTLGSWTGYNFDSPVGDEAKLCILPPMRGPFFLETRKFGWAGAAVHGGARVISLKYISLKHGLSEQGAMVLERLNNYDIWDRLDEEKRF